MAEAYPLQWPEGRERTTPGRRIVSKFKTTFAGARDGLIRELSRLKSRYPVLSTNVELRLDGLPYAGRPEPKDPGVAVYFEYNGRQMCFACDKYTKVAENIHAVSKTIEALRGIARWGTGDMMERAFTGFAALPNKGSDNWRDVLGAHGMTFLREVEDQYKRLRAKHHPDRGGNSVEFQRVMQAWEQAQRELK